MTLESPALGMREGTTYEVVRNGAYYVLPLNFFHDDSNIIGKCCCSYIIDSNFTDSNITKYHLL